MKREARRARMVERANTFGVVAERFIAERLSSCGAAGSTSAR